MRALIGYLLCMAWILHIGAQNKNPTGKKRKYDSLLNVLKNSKDDTTKVKTILALSRGLQNWNKDSAILICKQGASLSEKIKWKYGAGMCYGFIATISSHKGDLYASIDYYEKSLRMLREVFPPHGGLLGAGTLGNVANIYFYRGDYGKALDYYLQALKINEAIGNNKDIAIDLGNVGLIYQNMNEYSKARIYHFKALKLQQLLGDSSEIARQFGSIGHSYKSQLDSAIKKNPYYSDTLFKFKAKSYFSEALEIDKKTGNKELTAFHLANLGTLCLQTAEYDKSLSYFLEARKIREALGNINELAMSHVALSSLYSSQKKFKESINSAERALALSLKAGNKKVTRESYQLLTQQFEAINQHEKALLYYKLFVAYGDSIVNEDNTKKAVQAQMQYEFDKKESRAKTEQEKKDALATEEKKKQAIIRNAFITGFGFVLVFVLVLTLLIFRSYRSKQKANLVIMAQKNEVERAKATIEKQKQMVEEKQKEIVDSIRYAKRIQQSLMPNEKYIERKLKH
jgi:tetratricopeptide (TPR) repeat protein